VVTGDLSPAPPSVPGSVALVPMRKNPGMLSPAPKSARKSANEDAEIADVVGKVRVDGIDMSPPGSPGGKDGDKRPRPPKSLDDEDEESLLKKFKTAEALLLTPSPGAKRVGSIGVDVNRVVAAMDAIEDPDDAMGSPDPVRREGSKGGSKDKEAPSKDTPTFNFRAVAAAVESSIAWLDDGANPDGVAADGRGVGDKLRWTVMHSLLAALPTLAVAAAASCHATEPGGSICGVRVSRKGGLGVDPRLASGTLRHVVHVLTNLTNENLGGCAVLRTAPGGLETAASLVPWCAALEGLIPGCGPSEADRRASSIRSGAVPNRGSVPKTLSAATRARMAKEDAANAAAAGVDMLNAAMCMLVNASEIDGEVCGELRVLEADAGALEELTRAPKRASSKGTKRPDGPHHGQPVRPLGLVELLAGIFVRTGGAGPVDANGVPLKEEEETEPKSNEEKEEPDSNGAATRNRQKVKSSTEHANDGEVTAEMLRREADDERESDGLITQAYAALLTAFLVEGQPALRADVVYVLPEGGLNALASVLERFRTFHENLESISESSHASLTRIIRWLKGGN